VQPLQHAAPSYRQAFEKRRCLIPADGFYEWRTVGGMKTPFSIGTKDDRPFVFAGLWEGWKDPATDEWLLTRTIITGEPNELVAQIHPGIVGVKRSVRRKAFRCPIRISRPHNRNEDQPLNYHPLSAGHPKRFGRA